MSQPSSVSPDLFLLDSREDFHDFALKLLLQTRRNIAILCRDLDPSILNADDTIDAISILARSSRYAQIQILVKNSSPVTDSTHKIIQLAQRLSSKIVMRKLTVEPNDKDMEFMLFDSNGLLFKNDCAVYKGFANFKADVEVKRFREMFDYLWEHGEADPELQQLDI